jgi:Domain of unknown function (DUF4337)
MPFSTFMDLVSSVSRDTLPHQRHQEKSGMSESMERAQETMHGAHHSHGDPWARGVAVLVSVLAATLALSEVGGKSAQNAYLTDHIGVSDDWAFYQAKNLRVAVLDSQINVLDSLPNASDPAIQAKIKTARDEQARLRDQPGKDGMKQIAENARERTVERDHAFHRYHYYEYASGALEIAIVLASVSVVTRMKALTIGAGVVGFAAGLFALGVAAGVI